jgi:hypothetical protein
MNLQGLGVTLYHTRERQRMVKEARDSVWEAIKRANPALVDQLESFDTLLTEANKAEKEAKLAFVALAADHLNQEIDPFTAALDPNIEVVHDAEVMVINAYLLEACKWLIEHDMGDCIQLVFETGDRDVIRNFAKHDKLPEVTDGGSQIIFVNEDNFKVKVNSHERWVKYE